MATFNPYKNAVKESINVDSIDRHSPQKVILCNRGNKFYGEFIGKIDTHDVQISGGVLTNVTLSNAVICDDNGVIDLSSIGKKLIEIGAVIDVDIPAISSLAENNASAIQELSGKLDNYGDEFHKLSVATEKNISCIRGKISTIEKNISGLSDMLVVDDFSKNGRISAWYDDDT